MRLDLLSYLPIDHRRRAATSHAPAPPHSPKVNAVSETGRPAPTVMWARLDPPRYCLPAQPLAVLKAAAACVVTVRRDYDPAALAQLPAFTTPRLRATLPRYISAPIKLGVLRPPALRVREQQRHHYQASHGEAAEGYGAPDGSGRRGGACRGRRRAPLGEADPVR